MASRVALIRNIVPGKIEWRLRVRVIRLWTLPDYKNPVEPGSLEMLLLDESVGKIHATVRKVLLGKFHNILEEGATYLIENLLVGQNDTKFRTTTHTYKLNFMGTTKCTRVDAPGILKNHFDFLSFTDILASTVEDKFLDAIGHVVEKDDLKEIERDGKSTKLIDIVLQDLEQNRVRCTLWANHAETMNQHLANHDPSAPMIIILQLCKFKKYYGVMGISNAYFGTRIFVNADLIEIHDYKQKMDSSQVILTQAVSQMSGYSYLSAHDDLLQTKRMTISELIDSSDECFGSVLARVIEMETENHWWYESCTKCAHRTCKIGNKYYCETCKRMVTAIPRFKLHVKVIDNTGSTTFILFDRLVSNFIGKVAKDLVAIANKSTEAAPWPSELDIFLDKQILFKVEVSGANIRQNWQSYTVKRLSHDTGVIQQFISLHNIQSGNAEEQSDLDGTHDPLASDKSLASVEDGNSITRVDYVLPDTHMTPTSKLSSKISKNDGVIDLDSTEASVTKAPKMARIKIEPTEGNTKP